MTMLSGSNHDGSTPAELQERAKRHLMLHFTDMSVYAEEDVPIIVRGEGCHVYDIDGRRYIDGLSGLYCVNLGHSHGDAIGAAAHEQMRTLPFTSNWTVAHPPGIELATRLAELSPPGLDRAFFTSGGAEAVESAWKLAVQWHQANGEPQRRKAIARRDAYHGGTLGALALTGLEECHGPFEPLIAHARHGDKQLAVEKGSLDLTHRSCCHRVHIKGHRTVPTRRQRATGAARSRRAFVGPACGGCTRRPTCSGRTAPTGSTPTAGSR